MEITKSVVKKLLDFAQNLNNKLYEKEGLTESVLDNQVKINSYRAKYDILDENEVITDDGFVQ